MKSIFTTLCAALFFSNLASTFAQAGDGMQQRLKGTYHLNGTESCTESFLGWDEPPNNGSVGSSSLRTFIRTIQGSITFDGAGLATETATVMTVKMKRYDSPPFGQRSDAFRESLQCDWTYSVHSDNTFEMQGFCVASGLDGIEVVQPTKVTVISDFQITGTIALGGNLLLVSDTEPVQQTLVQTVPGQSFRYEAKRFCASAFTFTRAPKSANENGAGANGQPANDLDPTPWW